LLFARAEDAEKAGLFEEALDGTITKRFVQHSLAGEEMKTPVGRMFSRSYNYNDEEDDQEDVHTLSREAVEHSLSLGLGLGTLKDEELAGDEKLAR